MNEEYLFFWKGQLSQWYPSKFKLENKTFSCAEQYMMWKKAVLFGDRCTAIKIMRTKSPKEQQALGREVKNFNEEDWNAVARQIVYKGNEAKFTQNGTLLSYLFSTDPLILVECCPYDKIWGIGLDALDALNTPSSEWPGKNWLGLTLTDLRNDLMKRMFVT